MPVGVVQLHFPTFGDLSLALPQAMMTVGVLNPPDLDGRGSEAGTFNAVPRTVDVASLVHSFRELVPNPYLVLTLCISLWAWRQFSSNVTVV